jgi:hypothetical protein
MLLAISHAVFWIVLSSAGCLIEHVHVLQQYCIQCVLSLQKGSMLGLGDDLLQ